MSQVIFSGFNGIDWNTILDSVMQQAREPYNSLTTRQTGFKSQLTSLGKLTSQANTLLTAAKDLQKSSGGDTVTATTTDAAAVSVSTQSSAIAGSYDVVVQSLARAQTTASVETLADTNTTIAATGGSLQIGDATVTLTGPVTLQGLADAINDTDDIGVAASIVRAGANAYRLVLTGKKTGADEAFAITNSLTGSALSFGANAVEASDASILVNNVEAVSSTNTFDSAAPGLTLTVLKADPGATVGVNVTASSAGLKTRIDSFVKAYNDLQTFVTDQNTKKANGDAGSLAGNPMLRQFTTQLRSGLSSAYGSGSLDRLSQIGIEFTITGTLKLDAKKLETALTSDPDAVVGLVTGATGAFGSIATMLDSYTNSGGLLKAGTDRLNAQVRSLDTQIAQAEDRLAVYRQTMQQEFLAAEMAMSRLSSQSSALSGIGG